MTKELPKLTDKQQAFVLHYSINGNNASEAYRSAYDCSNMSDEAINNITVVRMAFQTTDGEWIYSQNFYILIKDLL